MYRIKAGRVKEAPSKNRMRALLASLLLTLPAASAPGKAPTDLRVDAFEGVLHVAYRHKKFAFRAGKVPAGLLIAADARIEAEGGDAALAGPGFTLRLRAGARLAYGLHPEGGVVVTLDPTSKPVDAEIEGNIAKLVQGSSLKFEPSRVGVRVTALHGGLPLADKSGRLLVIEPGQRAEAFDGAFVLLDQPDGPLER